MLIHCSGRRSRSSATAAAERSWFEIGIGGSNVPVLGLLLFVGFFFATAAFAAGEPPAGMVMSVSGSVTPALAAMSEIPADTPLRLAEDAELTFLHYGRCKLVTVTGGTVNLV